VILDAIEKRFKNRYLRLEAGYVGKVHVGVSILGADKKIHLEKVCSADSFFSALQELNTEIGGTKGSNELDEEDRITALLKQGYSLRVTRSKGLYHAEIKKIVTSEVTKLYDKNLNALFTLVGEEVPA